jgi:2-dehydropantoate 2-reductase
LDIKTVTIIGLGALGVLYGHQLSKQMPAEDLRIVADEKRIERYRRDGIYSNGEPCHFQYFTPEQNPAPADLLIFAVKSTGLNEAINEAQNHVGPDTIILSLLNGIRSEEIIGRAFGPQKVLLCVAQGMDAVKVSNRLVYSQTGLICFGAEDDGSKLDKVKSVEQFFIKTGIPHEVVADMRKRQWGKLMLNVGLNQTAAVYGCNYGGTQIPGEARDTMISAMREVLALSEKEHVRLTEADIDYWLGVLSGLNPEGKPSMQQDVEAKRFSEVELFAGTILRLAEKHNLPCPTNEMLYDRIKELESNYE